jgi:hypothetical protein
MNRIVGIALILSIASAMAEAQVWPVTPRGVGGTFGEFRLYSSGAPRYHLGTDVVSCGDPVVASILPDGGYVTGVKISPTNNNHVVQIDDFYEYDHLANDSIFAAMLSSFTNI